MKRPTAFFYTDGRVEQREVDTSAPSIAIPDRINPPEVPWSMFELETPALIQRTFCATSFSDPVSHLRFRCFIEGGPSGEAMARVAAGAEAARAIGVLASRLGEPQS